MDETGSTASIFALAAETVDLWYPAARRALNRLGYTQIGAKFNESLKRHIPILRNTETERAFAKALHDGFARFAIECKDSVHAIAVAQTLQHLADHDTSGFQRSQLLSQILDAQTDLELLGKVVKKNAFALKGIVVQESTVVNALNDLIVNYLRPSLMKDPTFAERTIGLEIINLLRTIATMQTEPHVDLDVLIQEHQEKMVTLCQKISWQGIAIPIGNRTNGAILEDIFVPVLASDINGTRKEVEINQLLEARRCVILGDPGSGKSTSLTYILWAICSKREDVIGVNTLSRIAFRFKASDFAQSVEKNPTESLEEYLINFADRFSPLLQYAIGEERALILIDGLDEIGSQNLRQRIKSKIDDFAADPIFAGVNVIITTRVIGYERSGVIGDFSHVKLNDFSDKQIEQFVRQWYRFISKEFPTEIDTADDVSQLLSSIFRIKGIYRLAKNPLTLTIIALLKWQGKELPEQRIQLYETAFFTLTKNWPQFHRNVTLNHYLIRRVLQPVALHALNYSTQEFIPEKTLTKILYEELSRELSLSETETQQACEAFLLQISQESGVLTQHGTVGGEWVYGFLHRTFAEYLCAVYVANQWRKDKSVLRYVRSEYWREVVLLAAAHISISNEREDAGEFLQYILDLQFTEFDEILYGPVLLAASILGDGTGVSPRTLVEEILTRVLVLIRKGMPRQLANETGSILKGLRSSEYRSATIRIAKHALDKFSLLTVGEIFGIKDFEEELLDLLDDPDALIANRAAKLYVNTVYEERALTTYARTLRSTHNLNVLMHNSWELWTLEPKTKALFTEILAEGKYALCLSPSEVLLLNKDRETTRMSLVYEPPPFDKVYDRLLTFESVYSYVVQFLTYNAPAIVDLTNFTVEFILSLLRHSEKIVRLNAGVEIVSRKAKVDPDLVWQAVSLMKEELPNQLEREQLTIASALLKVEPKNLQALTIVSRIAEHGRSTDVFRAIELLKGNKDPVEWTSTLFSHPNPWVRFVAAARDKDSFDGKVILNELIVTGEIELKVQALQVLLNDHYRPSIGDRRIKDLMYGWRENLEQYDGIFNEPVSLASLAYDYFRSLRNQRLNS